MVKEGQFSPSERLLDTMVREAIVPTLSEVEGEVGVQLPVLLRVVAMGVPGLSVAIPSPQRPESLETMGEMRLYCREAYGGVVNFVAEAVYRGLGVEGFSGFELKGKVRGAFGEQPRVHRDVVTLRYHVWDWQGWF